MAKMVGTNKAYSMARHGHQWFFAWGVCWRMEWCGGEPANSNICVSEKTRVNTPEGVRQAHREVDWKQELDACILRYSSHPRCFSPTQGGFLLGSPLPPGLPCCVPCRA